MATKSTIPTLDQLQGREALELDLPRVLDALGHASLEDAGWVKPDALTLLVPMSGILNGASDEYLLKLGFHAYRTWPPSAQFVNPQTRSYRYPEDLEHLPILQSPEVHVHSNYTGRDHKPMQLICCSATLEFYDVLHGIEDRHMWDETRNTFLTTITAIAAAFRSEHYKGRHKK